MRICVKPRYLLPLIFSLLVIPISASAFAQTSYDINIPTGSASPDAPYFWQSEKDGSTTGIIDVLVGDTVVWKNADTAVHTVTSGTAKNGPDDIFDSGMFGPGKTYSRTFSETGNYPYYCLLHPWMIGQVIVTEGHSIIPGVGKDVGDGSTYFDVEYDFNRLIASANVDEDEKSITLNIIGVTKSEDNSLKILLPSALISGPFVVFVEDEMVEFENIDSEDLSILIIDVDVDAETIIIIGTSVVPEFGTMTMIIMIIAVSGMVVAHNRFKIQV